MSAEEVCHSAIRLKSEAKIGARRKPVEEREDGRRGKRMRVEFDEIDNMVGCK